MKKLVKTAAKILLGVVLLLAVLLLAHPLWLAPAAKTIANSKVPEIVKADFSLGKFSINGYSGEFLVGDMLLGNPEGYDERIALKVGEISVAADMATVCSDVIVLKEVLVKDVFVSYVHKGGVNNFDQIAQNASGGKKSDGVSGEPEAESAKAEAKPEAEKVEKESKRVIIDRLVLDGITVKLGPIPLPVPSITLTGIGRKSNGVTFAELGEQLLNAIMKGVGAAKDGLKALGSLIGEGTADLTKQLEKVDVKAAGKILDGSGEAVQDSLKKSGEAVQDSLKKSSEAVKDAAGALKSLFK